MTKDPSPSPSPSGPEFVRRDVDVRAQLYMCIPNNKSKYIFKYVLTSTLEVSATSFQVYRFFDKTVKHLKINHENIEYTEIFLCCL